MKALVPAWRANSLSHNWFNEFDQMFDQLFETNRNHGVSLACDIDESEKFLLFSFDLPGLKEEDINVELKDSILSISGERTREVEAKANSYYRGRNFGRFQQSFRLPKNIDQEKIEVDYTHGVLKILLPKTEASQPRKIEVKSKKGGFLSDLLNPNKESSSK